MIAKPEDSRRTDPEEAARHLSRELAAIERAHGRLDRHAEGPPPLPTHSLGDMIAGPRAAPSAGRGLLRWIDKMRDWRRSR